MPWRASRGTGRLPGAINLIWKANHMGRLGCLTIVGLALLQASLASWATAAGGEKRVVHLYFADAKKPFLVSESRVMVDNGDPVAFGRQVVAELIGGPAGGNLAPLPEGTQLRAFFLVDEGTAVVDFTGQLIEKHPGGCRREQLTLFCIVNSLVLNLAEIDRVKILINGTEMPTLSGHLPLVFPLTADLLLTR